MGIYLGHRPADYHPIHLALNSTDGSEYQALKRLLGHRHLYDVTPEEVATVAEYTVAGTRTHFLQLLSSDLKILSFMDLLCELE